MKSNYRDASVLKKIVLIGLIFLLVSSFFVSYARSEGQTLTVDITGSTTYQSIQKAIDASHSGDTIRVLPGIYHETITIDKTISLIGAGSSNTTINGDGQGNVTKILMSNVQMSGFMLTYSSMNISNTSLWTAGCFMTGENISFSDCKITDCQYGMYIKSTSHTNITNCTISAVLTGVQLINCSNDILVDINVTGAQRNGIALSQCNNSILSRCLIADSLGIGLAIAASSWNVISYSKFSNNSKGIWIFQSQPPVVNNMIFSNDFIRNKQHAYDASNNSWDNGTVGNYWDDYTGTDTNGDGIGDTSIFIPLVSKDTYPRMNPMTFEDTSVLILKVTSLTNNAVVNGSILIEGIASAGQQQVLEVKIQIDNETEQIAEGTTHWQKMIDTSRYTDGPHLMKVTAVIEQGQMQSVLLSFTIKNTINDQGDETPGFSVALVIVCLVMYIIYRHRK